MPSLAGPIPIPFLAENPKMTIAGAVLALFLILQWIRSRRNAINVPAVTPTGVLTFWYGSWKAMFDAPRLVLEGYKKYPIFKIPQMGSWMVVVSAPELVDELRKAPGDVLSYHEASNEAMAIPYTLGTACHTNPYHVYILRGQLTRNLPVLFDDIRDEMDRAWTDVIGKAGITAKNASKKDANMNVGLGDASNEWVKIPTLDSVLNVVSRMSNRAFVGMPLCRDETYLKLTEKFAMDVVFTGVLLNIFPRFLQPVIGNMLTLVPNTVKKGITYLKPLIEERQRMRDEYGKEYPGKPNDLLSWLMDDAMPEEQNVRSLTMRVFGVNFAAIHTTSISFTQALFYLAAEPEKYLPALREEVETVIKEHGWTKVALGHMRKVDSFLRESQRMRGIGALTGGRKTMAPYTFSDGTTIPAGTTLAVPANAIHVDPSNFGSNAHEFDGFRFADLREEDGEGSRHQLVNVGATNLAFGIGKSTCPGRFFAATALKAMLAYLVMNYDIKAEQEGVCPLGSHFGSTFVPNSKASILLKKHHAPHSC